MPPANDAESLRIAPPEKHAPGYVMRDGRLPPVGLESVLGPYSCSMWPLHGRTRSQDSAVDVDHALPGGKTTAQVVDDLCRLTTTDQLINYYGYPCERHEVFTADNWRLTLFRIPQSRRGGPRRRLPVILWHGLSTTSAIWACNVGASNNLAFVLSDAGFDVWLGNTRGTQYTQNMRFRSHQTEYWDFSLDDLVIDVTATVDYVRAAALQERVLYVGFSQGTAQMFAALADVPELNRKVAYFAAMAPALKPRPINCAPLTKVLDFSANTVYTMFGRRAFMPIAMHARQWLPAAAFESIIRNSMWYLFKWGHPHFEPSHQRALYSHVFGTSSTKVLCHWFQVMKHGLRRYHDCRCQEVHVVAHKRVRSALAEAARPSNWWRAVTSATSRFWGSFSTPAVPVGESRIEETTGLTVETLLPTATREPLPALSPCCSQRSQGPLSYPTWDISTPTGLYYGGIDRMTDMGYISRHVSGIVDEHCLADYDHMDFVWSRDARARVWLPMISRLVDHDD